MVPDNNGRNSGNETPVLVLHQGYKVRFNWSWV
jgi:hypothetical protein